MLGSSESETVTLISREIIFAEFQPMITIPQRHKRTDGQLSLAIPRSARLRAVKTVVACFVRPRCVSWTSRHC